MLPITRGNFQNFCRVCLCELSLDKQQNHKISGDSLNKAYPQKFCNSCHLRIIALKEFQRKTVFSTGILRLIFDEDKSKIMMTGASLDRLLKLCRVCLKRQSNEIYNIRSNQEISKGLSECTGVQMKSFSDLENIVSFKKDNINDELEFPNALCNRCYATLKCFLQFKLVSKQTTDYLKNVFNKNEDTDFVESVDEHLKTSFDLQKPTPSVDSHNGNDSYSTLKESLSVTQLVVKKDASQELHETNIDDSLTENEKIEEHQSSDEKLDTHFTTKPKITKQRDHCSSKLKLSCHDCNKSFRKQFLYEAHIKSVHKGIENPFECPHCAKTYANANALQHHMSCSHRSNNNQNIKYICKYCDRIFKRNVRLKEHISAVHQKLKPYTCGICKKAYGTKNTLVRHEKNHSSEKPFSCEFCGKRYNSKSDLNVHIQRHTANPELLCPICKRVQPDKVELSKHIERHSKAYQCTICGKIFKKMVNLREHVDTVHLKHKFQCQLCSLAFSARKSLKNHELSHNSTNWPEVCVSCKLYFKSKHSLLIHMKKSHTKSESTAALSESCKSCCKSFKTKDSLLQHMHKFHPFD